MHASLSFSVSQGAGQTDDRRMVSASAGKGCCSIFHPVDQVIVQFVHSNTYFETKTSIDSYWSGVRGERV